MAMHENEAVINSLKAELEGDLFTDLSTRLIYATDASVYREIPLAVSRPRNIRDIKKLINFVRDNKISLIPRTAGTSLAGQVVGNGIVVDVSKYFTDILELNENEKWVRVQPGVVLDELNKYLQQFGLFFGPETSTSNRCMIGGMVGNNSGGSHSLLYGSTRDHVKSIKVILSDGTEAEFSDLSDEQFFERCKPGNLEGAIYKQINDILSDKLNQINIRKEYPDKSIKRRNTGYAIDLLLETNPFAKNGIPFNFSKLICGSEGTLTFITEIKLNLVPCPPKEQAVICIHFNTLNEALNANLIALKYKPTAIELMDKIILDCTKDNLEQQKNRFFLQGDPAAILIVEFAADTREEIERKAKDLENELRSIAMGYHFPVVYGSGINKVWNLRKAGLGVLSNYPGDRKPVSVIEDTAISVELLPAYIDEIKGIIEKYKLQCVYYAHIGTGEIHLKPALNLKDKNDVVLFRTLAYEIALLVKKYRGSLSGEHGDGRLRGEFIPIMIGNENSQLLKDIKSVWDPQNIFNPGKITDTPRMDTFLRYKQDRVKKEIKTLFDFSTTLGISGAAEKCSGSGDCRKTEIIGGLMCPSYMGTKDENATTRARANILREFLSDSKKINPFNHKEIFDILDLCLSCKGCKSECPSNVDMAKLKAEFLFQYHRSNHIKTGTRLIAHIDTVSRYGSVFPGLYNPIISNPFISKVLKKLMGIASKRKLPQLHPFTFKKWIAKNLTELNEKSARNKQLYIFIDEFTNYTDVETGIISIKLLSKLGYKILTLPNKQSGRAFISKGFLRKAKKQANCNVSNYKDFICQEIPLIGIEPSAILSFRDEYPSLVDDHIRNDALELAKYCFTIDEFLAGEFNKNNIDRNLFCDSEALIRLHGHCHQKVLSSVDFSRQMLQIPKNYKVEVIPSGCCGMAGSFGYEKEHYDLSQKIGELILFPTVINSKKSDIIAAPGISCRQQIRDATGRNVLHPVVILYYALK
jgi:FAD/FMN-containing dehydrogenase/Fe-S oxidoreductase